jgi:PST family polysaccharide transporter
MAEVRVPEASADLDRSLLSGLVWTGGMRWTTQIFSWLSTLVVARILTPTDYGLVGMAGVYVGLIELVNEFGLGTAIVQRRELNESQLARLGGLAVLLGCVFFAVSVAVSGLLADFFGQSAVRWIVIVLSTRYITSGFRVLPRSLLNRDLEFRKLAWIDGVEAVVLTGGTLLLAVLGLRYWALVLGALISGLLAAAMTLAWRPHRLAWPSDFQSIAREVTFGWQMAVARVAWYAYSNADFAVVGRFLGSVAMGAYTFGWNIASIPVDRISGLLNRVTYAVFAAVQDQKSELRRYLLRLTEGLALITFPISIGVALVSDHFVLGILGEHWRPAIAPLRLLAIAAPIRSVMVLFTQVLLATGQAKRNMQFTLIAACILPVLFYIGSRWGTAGVAFIWVVGYPAFVAPMYVRAGLRATEMRASAYLGALWPAISATAAMTGAVMAVRLAMPAQSSHYLQLACEVLTGVVVYALAVRWMHGERVRSFRRLLGEMKR